MFMQIKCLKLLILSFKITTVDFNCMLHCFYIIIFVVITVMGCGGCPNHLHHYLKRVSAAITSNNTITYFYYIIYSTTLPHST